MNAAFYSSLLALSKDDRKELEGLLEDDCYLRTVVNDCAEGWRDHLKSGSITWLVRRRYLVRAALAAARYGVTHQMSRSVAAAFALTLCERIEHRAWELERAAQSRGCGEGCQ